MDSSKPDSKLSQLGDSQVYSYLFSSMRDAIIIAGLNRVITDCNPAFIELFGYSRDEIIGKDTYFMYEEVKDFHRMGDLIKENLNRPGFMHVFNFRKKDGTVFPCEAGVNYLKDEQGNSIGFIGTIRDVTNRMKAEHDLFSSERKYRYLFEHNPLPMWIYDLETLCFVEVNKAAVLHYGYSPEEFQSMTIKDIRPKEDIPALLKNTAETSYDSRDTGVWRHLKKNGELIYVEIISHQIIFNGRECRLVLSNDITRKHLAELELISAKEKAELSDRLKTEFLAQISHEIRTPVHTILSFASLLEDETKESTPDAHNYFRGIKTAGKRLIRTVDLILNASEVKIGTYQPHMEFLNLADEIIMPIIKEYTPSAGQKGIKLSAESNLPSSVIYGDRFSLNQIFTHLIDNAVKFTDAGSVAVTLRLNNGGQIEALVEDTGIGIAEEYIPFLFEHFSQEHQGYSRRYDGNGLGLALVKEYCEMNGCSITVDSVKGSGTKFRILFPPAATS